MATGQLQQPKSNKSVQQFLSELDQLTQRNRGGFSTFAEETGAQAPFMLPGGQVRSQFQPQQQNQGQNQQLEPLMTPDFSVQAPPTPQVGQQFRPQQGSDNISYFLNYYNPQPQEQVVGQTDDGGAILPDGTAVYQDGTVVNRQGQIIEGVASLPDGMILYSDGSVRSGGLENLIRGIFGTNQAVTQAFGNINPIEPTPGNVNLGTDIRTRDLTTRGQAIPDNARVLQILQDDGTRFGDISGHQGYGNSILVELPTGERLRFSHLAELPQGIQVGANIPAGTPFIFPGDTGNTYGEHLDLEYYDQTGQISDPANFSGFQNSFADAAQSVSQERITPEVQRFQQQFMNQQQEFVNQPNFSLAQPQSTEPNFSPAPPNNQLASKVANVGRSINAPELGISEAIAGDTQRSNELRAGTYANVGTKLNLPELNTNELVAKNRTNPERQLAGNLVDVASKPIKSAVSAINPVAGLAVDSIGDTGLSELVAGGETTNTSPGINETISNAADFITGKAGAGVERLKNAVNLFSDKATSLFNRPAPSRVNISREVGEVSGGNQSVLPPTSSAALESAKPNLDYRDPFFKSGKSEQFTKYIRPENIGEGALNLELFTDDFFQKPENVKEVFSDTYLAQPAQSRYIDYVKDQYRQQFSDPTLYDQADVDRILNSISDNQPAGFTPNIPAPKRVPQRSSGNPAEDRNRAGGGISSGPNQNFTPAYANYTSVTGQASYAPPPRRSQPTTTRGISSGPNQNYTPANANFSSNTGKSSYVAPKQSSSNTNSGGLFSTVSNIFRRFFN